MNSLRLPRSFFYFTRWCIYIYISVVSTQKTLLTTWKSISSARGMNFVPPTKSRLSRSYEIDFGVKSRRFARNTSAFNICEFNYARNEIYCKICSNGFLCLSETSTFQKFDVRIQKRERKEKKKKKRNCPGSVCVMPDSITAHKINQRVVATCRWTRVAHNAVAFPLCVCPRAAIKPRVHILCSFLFTRTT